MLACGGGPGSVAVSPADRTAEAAIAHAGLITTVDRVPRLLGPGWISTGDDDAHAVFAPDGGTLYFLKDTPGFDLRTIVSTTRGARGWSRPDVVSFSGQYPDGDQRASGGSSRNRTRSALAFARAPVDARPSATIAAPRPAMTQNTTWVALANAGW